MERDEWGPTEFRVLGAVLLVASVVCWALFATRLSVASLAGDAGTDVGLLLGGAVVTVVLAAASFVMAEIRATAARGRQDDAERAVERRPRGPRV